MSAYIHEASANTFAVVLAKTTPQPPLAGPLDTAVSSIAHSQPPQTMLQEEQMNHFVTVPCPVKASW